MKLKIHSGQRYLCREDNSPFFFLGDTAWELFHRLDRDEANLYLETRAAQRFTVIQAVILAEFEGLTVPNACGHTPLKDNDPERPNEDYFTHVDWIVNRAAELGLWTGMLPTWGDKWNIKKGTGPQIFTPENALVYGEWLGRRYCGKPVIWILGGDRPVETQRHHAILRAMAAGLTKGGGGLHLKTLHPPGGRSSADFCHKEEWLDFNMLQSGHCGRDLPNWEMTAKDYARKPVKPCMDAEPRYEDHPVMSLQWEPEGDYFDDRDVRKAAYWALFAGAHGHTYGCHAVWQFWEPKREPVNRARAPWPDALHLSGAGQMRHARALIESRPFFSRIPDQSLIASDAFHGAERIQAARGAGGSFALVYIPANTPVEIDLSLLSGSQLKAWWFDPRQGASESIGEVSGGRHKVFTPPEDGPDWVLVLDDKSRGFPPPGQKV